MGVDLHLIPVDNHDSCPFGHSLLGLDRWYELWEPIEEIEKQYGRDVPLDFHSYLGLSPEGEPAYGLTIETPYGRPLKMVPTAKLAEIRAELWDTPRNRAVQAYLSHCPTEWTAIYWH